MSVDTGALMILVDGDDNILIWRSMSMSRMTVGDVVAEATTAVETPVGAAAIAVVDVRLVVVVAGVTAVAVAAVVAATFFSAYVLPLLS